MSRPFTQLERHAALSPDRLAIAGPAVRLTYGELVGNVGKVAARLRMLGVKPGEVVALALPPQLEAVFALAAFHEAAVSCTLPAAIDVPARLGFDWVFATQDRSVSVGTATVVTVDAEWLRATSAMPRTPAPREYDDDDLCRLLFSSGTTGSPKAVPLTAAGLERRIESARQLWLRPRPFMSLLGMSTASGLLTFFSSMASGDLYLIPGGPRENLALLQEFEVAGLKASPIQLDALAMAMSPSPTFLPKLERIQSAGGFLPEALAVRLKRLFACEVSNLYGSSEVGTVSVRRGDSVDPFDAGSIAPDVEVQIVDEDGVCVPHGEAGNIRYRRTHQPHGYFREPDATADHFIDGWFYPGDRGALTEDARLRVEGRGSDVLNAAGAKVDPIVLETEALRYDGIADVAAFMAGSEDGVERIGLAFVSDEEPDVEDLAHFLRYRLGGSAPLVYVRLESIPRNAMGKVSRSQLAVMYDALVR